MIPTKVNQPDLTMVMDLSGIILEASLNPSVSDASTENWIGLPWESTVVDTAKARRLIDNVKAQHVHGFTQINQQLPSGKSLLVEFTAVRTGDNSDRIVVIGKNLTAVVNMRQKLIESQNTMERDFWKLRELETRYRTLVGATSEAVFILREPDLRLVDANDQALKLSDLAIGDHFSEHNITAQDQEKFRAMLADAKANGRSPLSILHLNHSNEAWMVRASAYEGSTGVQFMLQFSRTNQASSEQNVKSITGICFKDIVDGLPEALTALNRQNIITHSNQAFADLVLSNSSQALVGKTISEYIGKTNNDMSLLREELYRKGEVTNFKSSLKNVGGTKNMILSARLMPNEPSEPILILWRVAA